MSERRERRDRLRAEREARETGKAPFDWLLPLLIPYASTVTFLAIFGFWQHNLGLQFAALATSIFWGARIARRLVVYRDAHARLQAPTTAALPAPPEAVPANVADLPPLLDSAGRWLQDQGQTEVAERLSAGWIEVLRLAAAEEAAGAIVAQEETLRAEVERLMAQAEAAKGAEARQMWTDNATAAATRLQKLEQLAEHLDVARARIEGYRQLLKGLTVDMTRLGLSDAGDLAARGHEVSRQVDLLVRTRVELDKEGVRELPAAVRAQRQQA